MAHTHTDHDDPLALTARDYRRALATLDPAAPADAHRVAIVVTLPRRGRNVLVHTGARAVWLPAAAVRPHPAGATAPAPATPGRRGHLALAGGLDMSVQP